MSGAGRRGVKAPQKERLEDTEEEFDSNSFFYKHILSDQDQWYDAWSEELVTTYHILKDHCDSQGLPFLENCSFTDFLDFTFRHSSKRPPIWN